MVGLTLPTDKQLVGQALADDLFMFLKSDQAKIDRSMAAWAVFAKASGLHITTQKLALLQSEICSSLVGKAVFYHGGLLYATWAILSRWMSPTNTF